MSLTVEELRITRLFGLCEKEAEAMKTDAIENVRRETLRPAHILGRDRVLADRDQSFAPKKIYISFDPS